MSTLAFSNRLVCITTRHVGKIVELWYLDVVIQASKRHREPLRYVLFLSTVILLEANEKFWVSDIPILTTPSPPTSF